MDRSCVLVVEDDAAIRRGLVDVLSYSGYDVLQCETGEEGVALAKSSHVDVVLLDVMLPGIDGFAVLDALREHEPTLPVIMVTARGAEDERVRGLKDGADDYVIKPFSTKELLARIEAVLRRSPTRLFDVRTLHTERFSVDLVNREVAWPDGRTVALTERETAILRYLFGCPDRTATRKELLERVWRFNPEGVETRTVDMHVARLRDKLEDSPSDPSVILTIRGKGYKLSDAVTSDSGSS